MITINHISVTHYPYEAGKDRSHTWNYNDLYHFPLLRDLYKMKEKFTTIDLFAILRELRERCGQKFTVVCLSCLCGIHSMLPLGVIVSVVFVSDIFVGAESLG